MSAIDAVLVRGWGIDGSAGSTLRALAVHGRPVALPAPDGWHVACPVAPDEPIGLPPALVTVTAVTEATAEVALGSHGSTAPLTDDDVTAVDLAPGAVLVVDARCAFRCTGGTAHVQVWTGIGPVLADPDAAGEPPVRAAFDHIRVDVRDVDAAAAFYAAVLDCQTVVRYRTPTGVILQFAPGGVPPGVELWMEEGVVPEPSATEHLAFAVPDVVARVERARALGYAVDREPYRIGDETVAFLRDPDGHLVELNDFAGRVPGQGG